MNRLVLPKLNQLPVPQSTVWLLDSVASARTQYAMRQPSNKRAVARRLMNARIQSVESSNRIESVTVDRRRLTRLVVEGSEPRDRPEEEVFGYNLALGQVLDGKLTPPVTPELLRELHRLAQGGELASDAGEFKRVNNDIVAWDQFGNPSVLFRPPNWQETPRLVQELCTEWQRYAVGEKRSSPLLVSATMVLDFLAVHPFRDGNGRVSRLLTTMLLLSDGHPVLREVSHERLIERRKEEYYGALRTCTEAWGAGKTDPSAWWNYFLGILKDAYREAELEPEETAATDSESVELSIQRMGGEFSLAELVESCPGIGEPVVKLVLQNLRKDGRVRLNGRGRGARWTLVDNLGDG